MPDILSPLSALSSPAAGSALSAYVLVPAAIFLARTLDMGLSTLRFVFISQGRRGMATAAGFFESLIWLLVVAQALQHVGNPVAVVGYAGGYAFGTWSGLWLEGKMAMGHRLLRVILPADDPGTVVDLMREEGQGVTVVEGEGMKGPVSILFTVARRRQIEKLISLIREHDPAAFFAVEDVRQANEGAFPLARQRTRRRSFLRRAARETEET